MLFNAYFAMIHSAEYLTWARQLIDLRPGGVEVD